MAGKRASEGVDGLAEIDRLRQTFTRVVLTSLALLYFALAGITTAMDRVNGDDVTDKLAPLAGVGHQALEQDVSYVFSRQVAALPEPTNPESDRVGDLRKQQEIGKELEQLARQWFSISFQLLGTTLTVDLRLIAPVVPFLVLVVIAYLAVLHRKARALESVVATAASGDDAAAGLLASPFFRRHPNALLQFCVLVAGATLLGWLLYAFASLRELISGDLQVDYANAMVCCGAYLVLYVSHVHTQLVGADQRPRWYERIRQGIAHVRRWFSVSRPRRPRGQLFSASGLVLMSLVLGTAASCESKPHKHWVPRTGWEYLRAETDVTWFTGDDLIGSLIDPVMRPLYGAIVLISLVALIGALLPWRNRAWRWPRVQRWTLVVAASLTGSMVLLAITSICLFGLSNDMRFLGDVAALPVWVIASVWLWRARRQSPVREQRWELLVLIFVPAAATFGVQGVRYAASLALLGLPLLIIGSAIQCRIYRSLLRPDGGHR
jgi:hypothetical protein